MQTMELKILLGLWAVVTVALIIVFIRKGVVSMREEDALFLDKAEDHIRKEQEQVVAQITKLEKLTFQLGIASGVLLLVWVALWVYTGLTTT